MARSPFLPTPQLSMPNWRNIPRKAAIGSNRLGDRRTFIEILHKPVLDGERLMSETVGDFLVKRLGEWGVHRIYGYPGDGINGIMGALDRAKDRMRFVQVRHEEMAAFMACAHAKFLGEVGFCLATS